MNNNTTPSFLIGSIPVYGKYLLAPMDGYTDSPFRMIAHYFGSSVCISEFINGIDVMHGHPHLIHKITFSDDERPFAYQIFDDDPERILHAAKVLRLCNPDFIDINMGCSARNVSNRGAGAGLLKNPLKIAQIMESLVKELDVPITAKIRLGWDDATLNYMEVSHILQESGASLLTVHARTRKQEYSGSANWDAIGEVKNAVQIPVIGNGDVKNIEDADRLLIQTGCDGVMIGRAAIGNPWIFSGKSRESVSVEELYQVISQHVEKMVVHYGSKIGVILFRKHLTRYLYGYLTSPSIRQDIYSIEEKSILLEKIKQIIFK